MIVQRKDQVQTFLISFASLSGWCCRLQYKSLGCLSCLPCLYSVLGCSGLHHVVHCGSSSARSFCIVNCHSSTKRTVIVLLSLLSLVLAACCNAVYLFCCSEWMLSISCRPNWLSFPSRMVHLCTSHNHLAPSSCSKKLSWWLHAWHLPTKHNKTEWNMPFWRKGLHRRSMPLRQGSRRTRPVATQQLCWCAWFFGNCSIPRCFNVAALSTSCVSFLHAYILWSRCVDNTCIYILWYYHIYLYITCSESMCYIEIFARHWAVGTESGGGITTGLRQARKTCPLSQAHTKDANLRPKTQYFKSKADDTKVFSNRLHDSLSEQR